MLTRSHTNTSPHKQPFTVDRPVAAVDPSLQLALALAMAVVEGTPARAAVDNAEAYLLTQVGGGSMEGGMGWVGGGV